MTHSTIKPKSYLLVGFVLLLLGYSKNAFAATSTQQKITEEQIEIQRQLEEQKIKRTDPQNTKIKQHPSATTDSEATLTRLSKGCIKIWQLAIADDTFSQQQKFQIYKKYLFQCLKINQIKQIVSDVQLLYLAKGYTTSRASLSPQTNVAAGKIHINVKIGKIAEIIINKNKQGTDRLQSKTAFFLLRDKQLNIKDLEQGLDQLKRLASHKATMQIKPSEKEGYSIIDVTVKRKNLNKLTLTLDDHGSASNGKNRYKINYARDNFLGIGDNFSLSYQNVYNAKTDQYNKSQTYAYEIPLGYWTINYNKLISAYSIPIKGVISDFLSTGDTTNTTYTINRTLARIGNDRIKLNISHTETESKNYINNTLIDISSSAQSYQTLKLEYIKYFRGGYNIFNISRTFGKYSYGPPLNYEQEEVDKYSVLDYYNKYTKNIYSWLNYSITLNGKQALSYIGSAQRYSLTSGSNVRGYSESKSYFHGYALQNNFNIKVANNKLNLNIHYDFGRGYDYNKSLVDELRGYGYNIDYAPFDWIKIKYESSKPVDQKTLEKQGYVLKSSVDNYAIDFVWKF